MIKKLNRQEIINYNVNNLKQVKTNSNFNENQQQIEKSSPNKIISDTTKHRKSKDIRKRLKDAIRNATKYRKSTSNSRKRLKDAITNATNYPRSKRRKVSKETNSNNSNSVSGAITIPSKIDTIDRQCRGSSDSDIEILEKQWFKRSNKNAIISYAELQGSLKLRSDNELNERKEMEFDDESDYDDVSDDIDFTPLHQRIKKKNKFIEKIKI